MLSKSVAEAKPPDDLVGGIATALRSELARAEVISFARFMEQALYCPEFGYYEQERVRVGARGDYYTSVSTGPLFGELLARQFCQWTRDGQPLRLVEAGAHDGTLARDILSWLQACRPRVFADVQYYLVEPSVRRRGWQEVTLELFAGKVRWVSCLGQLGCHSLEGILFSNELLDAFPVHRLCWDPQKGWVEWGVAWADGRFIWRPLPGGRGGKGILESAGFVLPPELEAVLPGGFWLECSPAAGEWWRQAARVLRRGHLLTLDYGCHAEELLRPERRNGTVRAYARHRISSDVLASPGQQDLTAHVNFTQLTRAGEDEGLRTAGLWPQAVFLTRLMEAKWREAEPGATEVRQFHTLTHPEHLGRRFRVLVQERVEPPIRS